MFWGTVFGPSLIVRGKASSLPPVLKDGVRLPYKHRRWESVTEDERKFMLGEDYHYWCRRPSNKDCGRIVKALMSYITAKGLFGRQLAKRPSAE